MPNFIEIRSVIQEMDKVVPIMLSFFSSSWKQRLKTIRIYV